MNHSLGYLYQNGIIDYDTAYQASFDRKDFQSKYGSGAGLKKIFAGGSS